MRTSIVAAAAVAVLATASAGLAWMIGQSAPVRAAAVKVKRFSAARDQALMQTPSLEGVPPVANRIRISNLESGAQVNRPTTVSRFFAPGEIGSGMHAAAVVDGVPTPTQCNVMTRWADGSLQHALLTFKTSFPAGRTIDVEFVPAESTLAGPGLTVDQMLSSDYDFSATMEVTAGGVKQSARGREMLRAGMYRVWVAGPLMTQVIIEERGVAPGQDFTFNNVRSLHPIFVVTFFTGHRGVRVEAIAENAWLERLQKLTYDAEILTGPPAAPAVAYSIQNYTHFARTRWRRDLWSGDPIGRINIDHNLPYLIYSRALPNYDLSRQVSRTAVDAELAAFKRANDTNKEMGPENCTKPGGSCQWFTYFPNTGGRADIGVLPRWDVRYLYTFDPRLFDVMIANAGVSGHVPIHVRDSAAGKVFHTAAEPAADANSRVVSIDARPCYVSRGFGEFSCAADAPVFVGDKTLGPWSPDLAHQGSFTYTAYLTTGDWYYLEELYFWSSWNIAWGNNGNCIYCRGGDKDNSGVYGVVNAYTNIRGVAWGVRTLLHTAMMAPDGSPEKGFFTEKLLNNVAAAEGRLTIRSGLLEKSPDRKGVWEHGFRDLGGSLENPLMMWWPPTAEWDVPVYFGDLDSSVKTWVPCPMQNFNLAVFSIVEESGFPALSLRRGMLKSLVNQISNPDYNPYLVDGHNLPVSKAKGQYLQTWKDVLAAYKPAYQARNKFETFLGETELGYGYVALATASFLTGVEDNGLKGEAAYDWLKQNYPQQNELNNNPKWAIVPRDRAVTGSIMNPSSWAGSFTAIARLKGKAGSEKAPTSASAAAAGAAKP